MATIEEMLDTAISHHQASRLQEAEQLYRNILAAEPNHTDALHLLGLVRHQLGNCDAAIESISRALALQPRSALYWENLGAVLHGAKRFAEAIDALEQALRLNPKSARSYFNLGCAWQGLGEWDRAVDNHRQALELEPNYVKAHNGLGNALKGLGRWDEATDCYRQALKIQPNDQEANNNLNAALRQRRDRPLNLQAESYQRIGYAFWQLGQWQLAADNYHHAIRLQPTWAEAHYDRGIALEQLGAFQDAMTCYRRALQIKPSYAPAHIALGAVLQGQDEEAIAHFRNAIQFDPDNPVAHMNLGMLLLRAGQFEDGWLHYEWRLKTHFEPFKRLPMSTQPRWDGRPLQGRSILLYPEQGLGDTLQFIRYAAVVQDNGGKVLFECPALLHSLLRNCPGIDVLSANRSELPPFDVHAPLLSLPRLFGTNLANIPAHVPYLFAGDDLVRQWRERLSKHSGFKIGISWRGSPTHPADRQRSFHLSQFAPLAEIPGLALISLQKGPGTEQLAEVPFAVQDLGPDFDESAGAFMDSAAVMKNLDLVITSDTAIAHLAGALGVSVWVALPLVPDWRWLLDREDSPWYPTMRLFRQKKVGEWGAVFRHIEEALRERLGAPRPAPPQGGTAALPSLGTAGGLTIEVSPGELIDKITILEIKSKRIADPAKLVNVRPELAELVAVRDRELAPSAELTALVTELKEVNETLRQIEDEIRDCERRQDFGPAFIALARSVYQQNDRRAALKRRINDLLGSRVTEEKSYRPYETSR
jgi:tetratricopeptide (TPR) repeat protein